MTSNSLCICHKKGTSICSGCKTVYYCSMECQKQDWKKHKVQCNKIKSFNEYLGRESGKLKIKNKIEKCAQALIKLNYEIKGDQFVFCDVDERKNCCKISIIQNTNEYPELNSVFERYKNRNLLVIIIINSIGLTLVTAYPRVNEFTTPESNKFPIEPIPYVSITF